jgi:alkyl sulfatase BDS1-like metallo-beta-lactamase superfamily hydrolase
VHGFEVDNSRTITDGLGRIAHDDHVANSSRHGETLVSVRPGVWVVTGNGLSNQVFIDAPDGIIAIDTGECVEEMRAAIAHLRTVTDRPFAAVAYTHFHYVGGTSAVIEDAGRPLPIYGHERIAINRARTASEVSAAYNRGLVEQFGTSLPLEGPDGLVNVGLGSFLKNPAHAPNTPGYLPATETFGDTATLTIAGLHCDVHAAPSDADDSVTFWFPDIGVAVHNLVWPVLFNVFAIRGEEYRDPRILLAGIDHLISLGAEHLVPTHGAVMSGVDQNRQRATKYRDSIQFIWDQTVRWTNRGLTGPQLAAKIELPAVYDDDHITTQLYGVLEHHVRQVRSGLFGFFDGDEANLFPLDRHEHSEKMIDAMGGRDKVRDIVRRSIDTDTRWALELASYLAHSDDAEQVDRDLLSAALRTVGQRTSAANIRNWCLTRARQYDGSLDMSRHNTHRLSAGALAAGPASAAVDILRVLLDPDLLGNTDLHIGWVFEDGSRRGLHLRHGVACPTDGTGASITASCELRTWASILGGKATLSAALALGSLSVSGDVGRFTAAMSCFDVAGLRA